MNTTTPGIDLTSLHPVFQAALAPFVNPARFAVTYCSQCGGQFGPGASGFSHCSEHKAQGWHAANDAQALKLQMQDENSRTNFGEAS